MKKLLKNSVFTLLFALAFLLCGVVSVGAAEKPSINNTTISLPSGGVTFMAMEEGYYVIDDSDDAANISLKAKKKVVGIAPNQTVYTADVSVIKCKVISSGACATWSVYEDSDKDDVTMDKLYRNMSLNLKGLNFADELGYTTVLGKATGELTSVYGLEYTYFVVVQYKQANMNASWLFSGFEYDIYDAEVYKVALASELADIRMATPIVSSQKVSIGYVSGTPISTVRYFKSAQELTSTFDFEAQFAANGGQVVLERAKSNNVATGGLFAFDFELSLEEGYYYIEATDLEGNTVVDCVKVDADNSVNSGNITTQPNHPGAGSNGNNDDNVNNESIGRIIFISLVVILVISVVLVIAQKIADNRKKIY